MKTIGRLLVAEFYHCDREILNDEKRLEQYLRRATEAFGATIVGSVFHRFDAQGASGTILIAESHVSIHTWPEAGYAAVDIYTCGDLDPRKGFDFIALALRATSCRVQEIMRGLTEEVDAAAGVEAEDVQIMSRTVELREFVPPGR